MSEMVSEYIVSQKIFFLRGQKVMLSQDLATLYGVAPKVLIQAVKRNPERFPADFMFQLSKEEFANLRSQIVTLNGEWGKHPKYVPYAFTEHGVAMLSSVLRSKRAIQVNIEIMRAFSRLRKVLASHRALARRLDALEKKVGAQDSKIQAVFDAIRELMKEPEKTRRKIGFTAEEKKAVYKM